MYRERFKRCMVILAFAVFSYLVSVWYKGMPFGAPLNLFFQMLALDIAVIVLVVAIILAFFEKSGKRPINADSKNSGELQ